MKDRISLRQVITVEDITNVVELLVSDEVSVIITWKILGVDMVKRNHCIWEC